MAGNGERSASSSGSGEGASVSNLINFLTEARGELKKVSTPTRQETIQATLVTLVIMIFLAVCLFLLDLMFSQLMRTITG